MKEHLGVVFGRFQPFHIGHLDHILTPFEECDKVIIGVTNPDNRYIRSTEEDQNRSKPSSNPFTYFQRLSMISDVLASQKIEKTRYDIIPFPINYPDYLMDYSPSDALYYVTLLENDNNRWNHKKVRILENLGLRVTTRKYDRIISATEIRKRIRNNQSYREFVPEPVFMYLQENNIKL